MLCAYQFLLLLLAQPVLMVQFSIAQDIRFPDDNDGYDISDLHVSGSKPASNNKRTATRTTASIAKSTSTTTTTTTTTTSAFPTVTTKSNSNDDNINGMTDFGLRSGFGSVMDDFGPQLTTKGLDVTERKPLKSPSQCKENMLLYPDDGHKSAWVCDCVEGFVYYPFDDNCYKPFSRGPCPEHEYIYLKVNESVPSCIHNPCNKTGEVPYENRGCFTLNSRGGACDSDEALLVNVTTYQLQCVSQFIAPEIIIDAPQRSCPRGSRRNNQGQCKDVL